MEQDKIELKKQYKVNFRLIISLMIGLAFISVILFITMLETAGNAKNNGKHSIDKQPTDEQNEALIPAVKYDNEILAVVMGIDPAIRQIILFDTTKQEALPLSYTGASDITDKYDQVISIQQIPIGTMVDIGYLSEEEKLLKMQISTQAWEYIGVNNLTIDRSANIMKIADSKYKYTDQVMIYDGDRLIPVDHLVEQDELTIRGYEETIWSITVTRGHGTVKLKDYEAFLGDNITIGYESMQQIAEDMVITVREGDFNLTVENGEYSATKNIKVIRNQETIVSLSDLGPEAVKKGRITFEISPFGADLVIDGMLTSYANPIELAYGEHDIEVSLGGFTTYQGTLEVTEDSKTYKIDLPESSSDEDAVVIINQGDSIANSEDELNGPETENAGSESEMQEEESDDDNIDQDHEIYVQSPIGASVYLNGEFEGIAPVDFEKIIGTHVLTFIMDGYETKSYTVEVPNDGLDTYFSFGNLVKK